MNAPSQSFSISIGAGSTSIFVFVARNGGLNTINSVDVSGQNIPLLATETSTVYTSLYGGTLAGLTGSQSLDFSVSGTSPSFKVGWVAYSGTATANVSPVVTFFNGTAQPTTNSITTTLDKSWVGLIGYCYTNTGVWSGGTGATVRENDGGNAAPAIFDTNGVVTPAGSKSMTVTSPGNGWQLVMFQISPVLPTNGNFLMFM